MRRESLGREYILKIYLIGTQRSGLHGQVKMGLELWRIKFRQYLTSEWIRSPQERAQHKKNLRNKRWGTLKLRNEIEKEETAKDRKEEGKLR